MKSCRGKHTEVDILRMILPCQRRGDETHANGIRLRWEAGYTDTVKVLAQAPSAGDFDPLEGFILHETEAGRMKFEG